MMHKAWSNLEKVPYFFQDHPSNFKVTRNKKLLILTRIGRFRTVTPVWIHPWLSNDAQSLMQYWRGVLLLSKVIHKISRSHGKKSPILNWIKRFRTVTSVWIHRWVWNDAQSLMFYRRCALLFSKVIHLISRSHDKKITNFDPNWAFPDCNFSLYSPMGLKWCRKLGVV